MPTTGQPILTANSMIAATLRPNISPTVPPKHGLIVREDRDRTAVDRAVPGDDTVAVEGVSSTGRLAPARRSRRRCPDRAACRCAHARSECPSSRVWRLRSRPQVPARSPASRAVRPAFLPWWWSLLVQLLEASMAASLRGQVRTDLGDVRLVDDLRGGRPRRGRSRDSRRRRPSRRRAAACRTRARGRSRRRDSGRPCRARRRRRSVSARRSGSARLSSHDVR